jgi:organic radical activating enzyme
MKITKQKINLREKLKILDNKVNFEEVVRGLGEYDGNVGIGTPNPSRKLQVHTDTNEAQTIACTSTLSGIDVQHASIGHGTNKDGNLQLGNSFGNLKVYLKSNGDSYLNGGNVGIGTTNPFAKLHLRGSKTVASADVEDQLIFHRGFNSGVQDTRFGALSFGTSGNLGHAGRLDFKLSSPYATPGSTPTNLGDVTTVMTLDGSGNVGIGTTDPSAELHVNNDSTSSTIRLTSSSTETNTDGAFLRLDSSGDFILNNKDSGVTKFQEQGSDVMIIDSNGNVGIGTTSPDGKLEVNSDDFDTLYLNRNSNTGSATIILKNNGDSGGAVQSKHGGGLGFFNRNNSEALTPTMDIDPDGNVGIGTTNPGSYKLNVNGTARVVHSVNQSQEVTSDDRVKHNEQPIVGALETLGKITPKKYIKTTEMYDANHDFELDADGNPIDANGEPVEHRIEAGVIAQQVLTVDELAFAVSPEDIDEDGVVTSPHGLDYNSLFTYAIAAIQELKSEIDSLKSQLNPDNSSPTQEPVSDETSTEEVVDQPIVDETSTEEVVDQPIVDETSTEEVVDQPIVDETSTEEVVDQPIVDETSTEEVVDQPIVDETSTEEVVDQPIVDETSTEEVVDQPIVDETSTEEVVDQPIVDETSTEEVVDQPIVDETSTEEVVDQPIVDETSTEEVVDQPIVDETSTEEVVDQPIVDETSTEEVVDQPIVDETSTEEVVDQPIVDETSTEEVVDQPIVDETSTEEVVDQPIVDETSTEEVVDQPIVDETSTEEVVDQPIVDETSTEEVVDQPIVDETSTEEVVDQPIVDETSTEEVVDQPIVDETSTEEVVDQPIVDETSTEEVVDQPIVDENPEETNNN